MMTRDDDGGGRIRRGDEYDVGADGVQWIVAVVSKRGDNNDYTLRFYSVSSDIP